MLLALGLFGTGSGCVSGGRFVSDGDFMFDGEFVSYGCCHGSSYQR